MKKPLIWRERAKLHERLLQKALTLDAAGVPSNADKDNVASRKISSALTKLIGNPLVSKKLDGQTLGSLFEAEVTRFIRAVWPNLEHLRPGEWLINPEGVTKKLGIAAFDQYAHLEDLRRVAEQNPKIKASIGSDYLIRPDIIIARRPVADAEINRNSILAGDDGARLTPVRARNQSSSMLHASISCKWTIRSDRSQNSRAEGLNLVRNRKGRLPHIAVVTAEPLPSRIASIALGTGDIDCVYHFALNELVESVEELEMGDSIDLVETMVAGKRLRDISDLPFDLVA